LSTALWIGSRGAPPTGSALGSRDPDTPRAPAVGQVEDPAPDLGPAVDLVPRSTVARAPAHHEFWDAVLDDERVHVYALDSLKRGQLATFPPAALEDTLPAERVEPTATVGPLGGLAWGAAEFAFGAGPKLVVQGYGAGRLTLELPPASGRLSALSWGADGALWVGTDAGQLWRLPADRERLTQVGAVDGVVEQVVASDPERRVVRIVQSTPRGPRSAWLALEGGSARPLWEADDDRATSGAADVDGVLVWGTAEGHVYLRRAGTTALCEEVSPHGRVVDVALAGPWVVGVLRQDEGLGELRVWDARSLALRARAPISGTPRAVDVQVRGERVRLLVTCFETLTEWDLGVGVR
ncbi:MAG: hypothetical protein R3F62_11410, partial [Planctomycetota bacterium]